MNDRQLRLPIYWPLFFLLLTLEAAATLFFLLRIPGEGTGFSPTRWALILSLLFALLGCAFAAYKSWTDATFRTTWLDPKEHPILYKYLTIAFPVIASAAGIGAFILRWWDPERLLPFFERAWPLLAYIILFSVQATLWLLFIRFGVQRKPFTPYKPALIAFGILLALFGFISLTKFGLTPDPAYWGEPGVPLQAWHLGLALMIGTAFFSLHRSQLFKQFHLGGDFLIGVLIWITAAGIWLSVPNDVLKNSFYFPIDPPANMPFPYSDSAYYDSHAHSLLIGTDYTGEIPTRPLYIVFLTVLHVLFGENYNLIIAGQTIVLAFIPVLFFSLGRLLHSRTAGVTIAILAIFREWTSLLVSSDTRVSNTKILLVDNPTLLLILLACLFTFRWLERKDNRSAFIAGGVFGVLLLLRTQSMLILPVLFLVAFLALRAEKRPWLVPTLLFILSIIITIAPWLKHNFLRIGSFTFDAPFQYQLLASQYAYTGNLDFSTVDLENKSLSQILITFILKDPRFVAEFITNHFLATEVGAMLALPLIFPFNGLQAPLNLYWTSFDGTLAWYNVLLIIAYLAVIALGFGGAWKRWRWTGLLPLGFNLGYAAANGIGRFSGWRYNLPADWIVYFYFGIGFVEILRMAWEYFGAQVAEAGIAQSKISTQARTYIPANIVPIAILFALIGGLPWIAKSVNLPDRYPDQEAAALQTQIIQMQSKVTDDQILDFASQAETATVYGRFLYPRTFGGNSGLVSSTLWPSYAPRDYPRLGFKLLNQRSYEVVFPNRGVQVGNVQGEDVIVLGCVREDHIEARILAFPNLNQTYVSDRGFLTCLD